MSNRIKAVVTAFAAVALALIPGGVNAAVSAAGLPVVDGSVLVAWAHQTPASSPSPRTHAAMAFDAATGTTVLFGGRAGSQRLRDTWTWNGITWKLEAPPNNPPPLESAAMAFDDTHHQLLLFGGIGIDGQASNGMWSWDGQTWTALAPVTTPAPRSAAAFASDPATGSVVLFGGLADEGIALDDTWAWDGAAWSELQPPASPGARSDAAATFDAARGVVVLFGGTNGTDTLADTWTWDGTTWAQHQTATKPPARADAAMAYDPAIQTSILHGGTGAMLPLGDTWVWNGTAWSSALLAIIGPPARIGAAIAVGPGPQGLVLFGGAAAGDKALADTWTLGVVLPVQVPTTPGPGDKAPEPPATSTTIGPPISVPVPGVGGGPAATPSPQSTTTTARTPVRRAPLAITARSLHRGDELTVTGSGFAPHATVIISIHSDPVKVGEAVTDAAGRFTATVAVPLNVAPGSHHFVATGPAAGGGQSMLTAPIKITVPGTKRSWVLPALMVALTILIAAAAGVVLSASGRWQHRIPA